MVNTTNTNVTFKGGKLNLSGPAMHAGAALPQFVLSAGDLSDLRSESLLGKVAVISSVPSLDTPVCSVQTKHFNRAAQNLGDKVTVLTVSMDLPFAQKRWCGAEGADRVVVASDYKYRSFGPAMGLYIEELGLLARAVFVVDPKGKIAYIEYVPEIAQEPDYDAALEAVNRLIG